MKNFTIKQMLDLGVHYGHDTRRWNPKMASYIFKTFNNVHIINLQKTAPLLYNALLQLKEVAAKGGRVLFVGTKRQASSIVKEYAEKCGQYYVNHRWLGGALTNWKTISQSINTLVKLEELINNNLGGYTKKEQLSFQREADKLNLALGGIRNMGGLPNILFVIDAKKETIAIEEATKLNIPVIAVVDTNGDPDKVTYPIPGNDDAIKAINFYCELACEAILEGLELEAKVTEVNKKSNEKTAVKKEPSEDTNNKVSTEANKVESKVISTNIDEAAEEKNIKSN
mgnify:CR=1 FL=1